VRKLKNKYDLLWDQKSPEGYLKIVAVLQKFIDQGISVNTSYNPKFYEEEKIPMSVMLQDILMFYKYGGKQLYYFNTSDGAGEIDVNLPTTTVVEEEDCDSCKI
jgi:ribonucleoside-diphosphate reductase alpha chain